MAKSKAQTPAPGAGVKVVQVSVGSAEMWFNPNVRVQPKPEALAWAKEHGWEYNPKGGAALPSGVPVIIAFGAGLIKGEEITPKFLLGVPDETGNIVFIPSDLFKVAF